MRISNFRLAIGRPLNFPMVYEEFLESFIAMEKPDYIDIRSSKGNVEDMRNELVAEALRAQCTHLAMLDTDQVYHAKTITRLLSHRLPVVGCLVFRRYPPFDPLMLRGEPDSYATVTEWEPGSLVEVDATGTGCLLFDMAVFRNALFPWFRFRRSPWGEVIGEDFGFCHDLRRKGYRIYVDTSVPAGHITKLIANEGSWKLYRAIQEMKAMQRREHGGLEVNIEGAGG